MLITMQCINYKNSIFSRLNLQQIYWLLINSKISKIFVDIGQQL